jgi:hypothetical protein
MKLIHLIDPFEKRIAFEYVPSTHLVQLRYDTQPVVYLFFLKKKKKLSK